MTTLEAVQEILRRNGQPTPEQLATDSFSNVGEAERILNRASYTIQDRGGRGWHFNTRRDVEIEPADFSTTGAAYSDANRRLTKSGAFTEAHVGAEISLEGTGLSETTALVAAIDDPDTGDFIDLDRDISTSGDLTDLTVTTVTNKLMLPDGVLTIDADGRDVYVDVAQNGGYLFDVENNTAQWDIGDTLRVRYVLWMAFGCVPPPVQELIATQAALDFHDARVRVPFIRRSIEDAWIAAKRQANYYQNRVRRPINVLDSADAVAVRGWRTRTGLWVGP